MSRLPITSVTPLVAIALLALALAACDEPTPEPPFVPEVLGRCTDFDELRRPLFGDLHVHTSFSLDANLEGTRLGPSDAYRYAQGEEVGIQPYDAEGNALRTVRIGRPLDFAAVTDHAEFLGTLGACANPESPAYGSAQCVSIREAPDSAFVALNSLLATPQDSARAPRLCGMAGVNCEGPARDSWAQIGDAAEAAYDRTSACRFTSLVGYEWSGNPGPTLNLHRNVIFRNHVVPELPITYFEESYPEGLWAALRAQCTEGESGCDVLTIPHNSNLSGGRMFEQVDRDGMPFSAAYAEERRAMEPLVEIFQHKGDSECAPGESAGDELCGFETLPYSSLADSFLDNRGSNSTPSDFVRHALGEGLRYEAELGANPFTFGIVASTDTHLATPGNVSEEGFVGHGGAGHSNRDELPTGLPDNPAFNPGGLAVVWAEENSREAIFLALRRRETYGTSGPRIVLRLFGGYGFPETMCDSGSFAADGYAGGVPMGGELAASTGGAPVFAVSALQDPGTDGAPGTPLQRIQIVKGWLEGGEPRFAVYDVTENPDNGASVDLATCEPVGEGASSLCEVWTDPDFDPAQHAFYYARVLENPVCRWHTRICLTRPAEVDCAVPESVPEEWAGCCDPAWAPTVQERAWSSPIWYRPEG